MRHEVGTFPGRPSSTPGSCRSCGVGRLRDGETGVVVTDWWIDQEGVIILCEACAAEIGRLVPDAERSRLASELEIAVAARDAAMSDLDTALSIVRSQRAEMALTTQPPKLRTAK